MSVSFSTIRFALSAVQKGLHLTSGYVRFYIAELDIKKHTRDFKENWDIETARSSNPPTQENILVLLNLVKIFREAVFTIIQVETGAWATEFQSQTGELYELFKQKQSEYLSPGNIAVTLENYQNYNSIKLKLDDGESIDLKDVNSFIFRNVSQKPHTLQVTANKDRETHFVSKNVDVTGDKTFEVTLTLP